jgi:hypothetical protein
MPPTTRLILTNWSKGELSPLLEGRPDLAAFFEGGSTIENFMLMRQGGATRRPGTRFIHEVKDSNRDTILVPFETSVDDAFMLEMGAGYDRPYKNKAMLPVEIPSPYTEAQLREVHYTQSVNVMFRFHQLVNPHKTARVPTPDNLSWSTLPIKYNPPPSFPDDTDISNGTATLTLSANTGAGVDAISTEDVFLAGDVGRVIVFGVSRATITSRVDGFHVVVTVLDDFPSDLAPIPAGQWLLRLAPQSTLDPTIKEPVGAIATLVAGPASQPTFRDADLGKFIKIYAGLAKITEVTNPFTVKAEIMSIMTGTDQANPPAAPAGSWGLEVPSWGPTTGFPGTGEFGDGRLWLARTVRQPTTFWASQSDDFDKFAIGIEADRAIDYTMGSRGYNQIQAIAENNDIFLQTSGTEHRATSGKTDAPFGGDVIPLVRKFSQHGSAMIQPIVYDKRVIFIDRSRRKIFSTAFNLEEDGYDAVEVTGAAEHITESKIRLGPWAMRFRLDPTIFFVREDGTLVSWIFHKDEKVTGFTRNVTNGTFEAVGVIPGKESDQVWVIVKRTILGQTKRYVELLEDDADELATREWHSCQTDSAVVYDFGGTPTTVLGGLDHLRGELVDVIIDGSFRGQMRVEANGTITLPIDEPGLLNGEVGLHYDSTLRSMRPAIKDRMTEGVWRSWVMLWVRLFKSLGGTLNGQELQYEPAPLGTTRLFTGDNDVSGYPDTAGLDGRITIKQDKPYPMTVLALFGEVQFQEHG